MPLLTASVTKCLQHSRNQVQVLISDPVIIPYFATAEMGEAALDVLATAALDLVAAADSLVGVATEMALGCNSIVISISHTMA